jgi:hypothetical protein
VAWLRVDTQTILTIQSHIITKNHRMSITHAEKRHWVLRIKDVKEADKGWYMCQVNTDPMRNQLAYLDVVGEFSFLQQPHSDEWPLIRLARSSPGHPGLLQHGHGGARGQQRDSEVRRPWLPYSRNNVASRRQRTPHSAGRRRR